MSRLALALVALLAAPVLAAEPADVGSTYRLVTEAAPASLRVGGKGRVVVAVEPLTKGVHVDPKAPFKVKVAPSAGLSVARAELRRADAVDPQAESPRFEIPFTATAAGPQEVRLQVDFYVCSDSWCAKQSRTASLPVQVQ
jgi:hypothetical protein